MKIELLLGDPEDDGHGGVEGVLLDVNVSKKQLVDAYKKGAEKLGYDFEVKAASEYGKRRLDKYVFDELKDLGWTVPRGFALTRQLDVETYVDIWLFLAKLGCPKLVVKKPVAREPEELYIGGYALFETED